MAQAMGVWAIHPNKPQRGERLSCVPFARADWPMLQELNVGPWLLPPLAGLGEYGARSPTACAVGYNLSPAEAGSQTPLDAGAFEGGRIAWNSTAIRVYVKQEITGFTARLVVS